MGQGLQMRPLAAALDLLVCVPALYTALGAGLNCLSLCKEKSNLAVGGTHQHLQNTKVKDKCKWGGFRFICLLYLYLYMHLCLCRGLLNS